MTLLCFLLDTEDKTWHFANVFVEKKNMEIRKHGEMGIFSCYYYYWYFGQVCPGLQRRVR